MREAGLRYEGHVHVRHPLDVLVNDIGLDDVKQEATKPLNGLKVACYYGCQVVRPYATFDDQHDPRTMHDLLAAVGAEPVDWPLGTRCCGGSLTGTIEKAGLRLCYILLREAKDRGADVIATCCPLCQFNLECYQHQIGSMFGSEVDIPVTYFSQLLGKAMGIGDRTLGLNRLFVPLTSAAMQRSPA
jgi:heterodisulfide reductase subunit B